jgi:hypothetical protein
VLADFGGRYPVIRNVVTGVTSDILAPNDVVEGASADLSRIAFVTSDALVPADTNGVNDLYLWFRGSNTFALVSRDLVGNSLVSGTAGSAFFNDVAVSNLGTSVVFSLQQFAPGSLSNTSSTYRYDASRSYTVKISDNASSEKSIGDNGTVVVDSKNVIAPSGTYPLPAAIAPNTQVVTSPNGTFVAWPSDGGSKITGVDASNGAAGSIAIPSWLQSNGYTLEGIANDASYVTLSAVLVPHKTYAYAHLDRSGNLHQIGSDIPLTQATNPVFPHNEAVLSSNEQFAITPLSLVKLGTLPLLGTEPTAPSKAVATDYFTLNDDNCSGIGAPPSRPTVTLRDTAFGSDLSLPVSGTIKAYVDGSTVASNNSTIAPGQSKSLYVGLKGGYRVDVTVTLADGQTFSGSAHVAAHDATVCSLG